MRGSAGKAASLVCWRQGGETASVPNTQGFPRPELTNGRVEMHRAEKKRILALRKITDEGERLFWGNHIHELDDACINTSRSMECEASPVPARTGREKQQAAKR